MGGTPLTALNICCFPDKGLPVEDLNEILLGGLDKIREAGACLLGGHTVQDEELKYGLSVNGLVHPEKVVRNSTAKPGDCLILTKRVGTGVILSGRRKKARWVPDDLLSEAVRSMAALNRDAARLMVECGVSAATDVTGFGLGGHAGEVARGSGLGLRLFASKVPFFEGAEGLVTRGATTRVTGTNLESVREILTVGPGVSESVRTLFFDPQTSGGLLISVPSDRADSLLAGLHAAGVADSVPVGEVFRASGARLEILS